MRERAELYADAFYAVILAEGNANEVQDELFRFSQAVEGNDALREALNDPHIPAARRQQIVEDLLGAQAFPATAALVSLVVAAGRARDLPTIVGHLLDKTASLTSSVIAEVRSAVDLSQDQKDRLAAGDQEGHRPGRRHRRHRRSHRPRRHRHPDRRHRHRRLRPPPTRPAQRIVLSLSRTARKEPRTHG